MSEIKLPADAESYMSQLVQKGYKREEIQAEFNRKLAQYMKSPQASKISQEVIVDQVFYATFADLNKYDPPVPVDFVFVGHGTVGQKDGNPWCTGIIAVNAPDPLRTVDGNDQYRRAFEAMIPMNKYSGKLIQKRNSTGFMFAKNCMANSVGPLVDELDPFKNLNTCLTAMKIPLMTVTQASAFRSKTDPKGRPIATDLVAIVGNIDSPKVFAIKEKDETVGKKDRKQIVLRDGTRHTSARCSILDKTVVGNVKPLGAWIHPRFLQETNGLYAFIGDIGEGDETNRDGSLTGKKIPQMDCVTVITLIGPPPDRDGISEG